ncbi:BhlA/UviB family holin-like peptide [Inconstantimicrobium mannanitabidum]|uniref:Bacteriocin UviB n=1 Tax=Inconstantimicrobium mannanitabidum TaxID=1604901 RepID=A0ACB5RH24_9CLOT|nr:BhlA/UviB family holin-like peptide [Clostridium sp. TW13]GKX68349.1 bacteriocin UviB [Clostridium sp. TW13]
MESNIIQLVATQGGFAVLFSYLLFYVLKENSKREENYQEIIKRFSDSLPEIKEEIETLNSKLKN